MKKFIIQSRETGCFIDEAKTRDEAEKIMACFEIDDMEEGNYTPDFYEIIEVSYDLEN